MVKTNLNILQVNTSDLGGGAEKIGWDLHQGYRFRGHNARLAVKAKKSDAPDVVAILNDEYRNPWARFCLGLSNSLSPLVGQVKGVGRLQHFSNYNIGQPHRWLSSRLGREDVHFPATADLLNLSPQRPDILHCHNLHHNYFDLRMLPYLSQQVPLVMTLHDAWLLSGHCAHSFDCDRWKTGCGQCPDLSIYPAIRRDATAYNWQRKQAIYSNSKLYIATPSRWLMDKVEQSMLNTAMIEGRVIPNGIDLSVFHPENKQVVRTVLGIPQDAKVLLFTANGIRNNMWKDYQTMRTVIAMLAERMQEENLLFIALGEDGPTECIGHAKIQFVPFQKVPTEVARYYQAADIYIHAAKAEVFGLVIAEALACGTPVVATAVGGISEVVDDDDSGFLVPLGNAAAMVASIQKILKNPKLQQEMGVQAAQVARQRFCLEKMVDNYLSWYQEIFLTPNSRERRCSKFSVADLVI